MKPPTDKKVIILILSAMALFIVALALGLI